MSFKAQSDCQRAHELEQSQRTQECLEKINKLIKQSKKRDYYKILGVKRNAREKEIVKAYRKLAKQWHPGECCREKLMTKLLHRIYLKWFILLGNRVHTEIPPYETGSLVRFKITRYFSQITFIYCIFLQ